MDCYEFMQVNRVLSPLEHIYKDSNPRDLVKKDENTNRLLFGDDVEGGDNEDR